MPLDVAGLDVVRQYVGSLELPMPSLIGGLYIVREYGVGSALWLSYFLVLQV